MTRRIVVDAAFLALVAASVAWVSRVSHGSRISMFSGRRPKLERSVEAAVGVVVAIGLVIATAGYGSGTLTVNLFVFAAATFAVRIGGQVVHNRAVDRR